MKRLNNHICRLLIVTMLAASSLFMFSGCRSGVNGELYVYCYGDYFDPMILEDFEAETGIRVIPDYYDTAEEMYTVLENNATTYDCVCTSDYMIQRMIENDMLAELNRDFGIGSGSVIHHRFPPPFRRVRRVSLQRH